MFLLFFSALRCGFYAAQVPFFNAFRANAVKLQLTHIRGDVGGGAGVEMRGDGHCIAIARCAVVRGVAVRRRRVRLAFTWRDDDWR